MVSHAFRRINDPAQRAEQTAAGSNAEHQLYIRNINEAIAGRQLLNGLFSAEVELPMIDASRLGYSLVRVTDTRRDVICTNGWSALEISSL